MSILQSIPDWEYHGIMVSYAPTEAQLIAVNKLTSRVGCFSRYLCVRGHKLIDSDTANKCYSPLALPDINIHYVSVPNRQTEFQLDLQSLLAL